MSLKWNDARKILPKHNQIVLIQSKHGTYEFAIFKIYNDAYFGALDLFVIMNDYEVGLEDAFITDIGKDWYRDYTHYDPRVASLWIAFDEIKPHKDTQPERLSEKTLREDDAK